MERSRRKRMWGMCILAVLFVLTMGLFAACSRTQEKAFTVTFYDGTAVIATETVESGGKVNRAVGMSFTLISEISCGMFRPRS